MNKDFKIIDVILKEWANRYKSKNKLKNCIKCEESDTVSRAFKKIDAEYMYLPTHLQDLIALKYFELCSPTMICHRLYICDRTYYSYCKIIYNYFLNHIDKYSLDILISVCSVNI